MQGPESPVGQSLADEGDSLLPSEERIEASPSEAGPSFQNGDLLQTANASTGSTTFSTLSDFSKAQKVCKAKFNG